jgi:prolyl 4-hydroxylase
MTTQYQEGARLLTHVDRLATHAVSLIVNVAQGNLDEPWPVEVYDHADRLHEIVMEPGDVIYYER